MHIAGIGVVKMAISGKTMQQVCDRFYPVGCYYFSNDSTDPGDLFGGTWLQITDCFIKAATSSSSEQKGNKTKTISNFCPPHTHTIVSHTHSLPNHKHSGKSIDHSHTISGHSHNISSTSHRHEVQTGVQSPPGTVVTENWDSYLSAPAFQGSYDTLSFKTASQSTDTKSSLEGSTTTSSDTLGDSGYASSIVSTATVQTNNYGTNGSCTFNIIPPYRECYCWRRTA